MSINPGQHWLDNNGIHINAHGGGMLCHEGVYYWFGEHKIEGDAGNVAHVGVHVYSSTDLLHWVDRGIALHVSQTPGHDIERGCVIERPKVLRSVSTGKFVMWFHLEPKGAGYSGAKVGVAVSDAPTGPYTFVRSFRPNAGRWPANFPPALRTPLTDADKAYLASSQPLGAPLDKQPVGLLVRRDFVGGQMSRDMTLFHDDDGHGGGAAYHLTASEENSTLHLSRLTPDLLDTTGHYVRLFPGAAHEAPALLKHGGCYYLFTSHCTGWTPNPLRLAVADSLEGPWTDLGNPVVGTSEQAATTFHSQSTFVLPILGRPGAFIFLADRWTPQNAIDGRYVWLPVLWNPQTHPPTPEIRWFDQWDPHAASSD